MIDLHCHSTASDGHLSPTELVTRAAAFGVSTLALTDHDTVSGLAEAAQAAAGHSIDFVNGVEISVTWQRRTLHIVGLAFDADAPELTAGLAGLQQARQRRAERIGEKLERIGLSDGFARAAELAGDGQITRPHFARLLIADGLCSDAKDAFKRYLRPGKPGHVGIEWATLDQAIAWIEQAGGLAVLAHPFGYGFSGAWRRRAVAGFAAAGGHALEICTGTSNIDQESQAHRDAREHGLAGSLGSDFHAPEQLWLKLGGVRPLPTGLATVWEHPRWPRL